MAGNGSGLLVPGATRRQMTPERRALEAEQHQHARFLRQAPSFERMLIDDGVMLRKYWFSVSDVEQEARFRSRANDPMRRWKLSPMDMQSITRWEDYSRAKDTMMQFTDISDSPWYTVESDDKKTSRTPSGFADIVTNVRALCGRSDPHRQDEWHRIDLGFVGLYVPGELEKFQLPKSRSHFEYQDPFARGIVRYFDVSDDPPRRGRPLVENTLTLEAMVERILDVHEGPLTRRISWGAPEDD